MHSMFERTIQDDIIEMGLVIMSNNGKQSLFEQELDFNVYLLINHAPCTIHDLSRYCGRIMKRHVYLQYVAISIYRLNDCGENGRQRICYDKASALYSPINPRNT